MSASLLLLMGSLWSCRAGFEATSDADLRVDAAPPVTWSATLLLGGSRLASESPLHLPRGVFADGLGNLFIADTSNHRIRRVDGQSGVITTVAGTGTFGFSGDGGAATSAELNFPYGVFADGLDNLFVADSSNHRIRRVDGQSGVITTVAGTGTFGFSGDGGAATSAKLNFPSGVFADGLGNLFIADSSNHRIRRVDGQSGVITTVAGTGTFGFSGDGGTATSADLGYPSGVFADGLGNLFVADSSNHRIRRVDGQSGVVTTVAGTGTFGFSGDGGAATSAELGAPSGVFADGLGNLFIADSSNHRIRRVDGQTGVITTAVGTGTQGFSGDGGAATSAELGAPYGVFADGPGNLFVADSFNHRIRRVDGQSGVITTVAGTGAFGFSGDGGAATSAELGSPTGVFADGLANLFIADASNHRIRRVDGQSGVITTVAGTGTFRFSGDGGAATSAELGYPTGVFTDGLGNLFIADSINHRIRRVDGQSGVITTVAGTGTFGFSGDGGAATSAELGAPSGVFADGLGNLFIADSSNHRIRRVNGQTGVITTAVGTGTQGFSGDGGAATSAELGAPYGVFADGLGNLFIADSSNHRIRRVHGQSGVITTVAGTGTFGFSGDGGAATSAELGAPSGVFADGLGNLLIADSSNHRIRRVDGQTGVITTVAGTGTQGFSGDGGAATTAELGAPNGVFADGLGNLFVADSFNDRIRRVDGQSGVITTAGRAGGSLWRRPQRPGSAR